MKHRSIKTLDTIIENPDMSATEAYIQNHRTTNRHVARTEVGKLLKKPEAQLYLLKHVDKAKKRIVELVGSKKEDVALRAAESILNREYGTPRQVTENRSTSLSLTIDLTGLQE